MDDATMSGPMAIETGLPMAQLFVSLGSGSALLWSATAPNQYWPGALVTGMVTDVPFVFLAPAKSPPLMDRVPMRVSLVVMIGSVEMYRPTVKVGELSIPTFSATFVRNNVAPV